MNIAGYHLVFNFKRNEIKTEMAELINSSLKQKGVQRLIISLTDKVAINELIWKDGKEFEWNGVLYDLVQKTEDNGKLLLDCIPDKKETSLQKDYARMNKDNLPKSNKGAIQLLKIISSVYTEDIFSKNISPFSHAKATFYAYADGLIANSYAVIVPPPKVS
jgi:DUF2075 family protein